MRYSTKSSHSTLILGKQTTQEFIEWNIYTLCILDFITMKPNNGSSLGIIVLQLGPLAKFLAEVRDYCSHLRQEDERKHWVCSPLVRGGMGISFCGPKLYIILRLCVLLYMFEVGSNLGTIIISTYPKPFTVMT